MTYSFNYLAHTPEGAVWYLEDVEADTLPAALTALVSNINGKGWVLVEFASVKRYDPFTPIGGVEVG